MFNHFDILAKMFNFVNRIFSEKKQKNGENKILL